MYKKGGLGVIPLKKSEAMHSSLATNIPSNIMLAIKNKKLLKFFYISFIQEESLKIA